MMGKRDSLKIHRWIALVFAPLLLVQALTGIALLFGAELARLTIPEPTARTSIAGAASLSTLVTVAATAEPGARVTRIFLPGTPRDAAFIQLVRADGAARYAALDPEDARVLAAGAIWRFPAETALHLHYRLNSGRLGMAIVMLNALALAALAFTGLLYWWPGRQRAVKALAVRTSAPPRVQLRQWHRSTGVLLLPLVLFSAISGMLLILPDLAAAPAAAVAPPPPPLAGQVDRAFARARGAFPGAVPSDIRFPAADRIDVNFYAPRHNSQAIDIASVKLSDGSVVKRLPAERNPVLWMKVLPLHSGTALGSFGQIVLLLEGVALMVLALTGPVMWWQARRPKRRSS